VTLRGIGLGRVLGVPVRLDLSWFVGLAVVVTLSRELWAPAVTGVAAVGWSVAFAVGFFACVLVHELAHALAARTVGVATTEIRLFVFGGVARIRGEPADPGGEALGHPHHRPRRPAGTRRVTRRGGIRCRRRPRRCSSPVRGRISRDR
jgi:Zn-dependent protease